MAHRFRVGLTLAVATLSAMGGATAAFARPPVARAAAKSRPSYYLALGDSVPVWNGKQAYPYLVLAHYKQKVHGLKLDDIGMPGETTGSMLAGQYETALHFLHKHRGHVALITMDIGGNDLVGCVGPTGIDQTCAGQALATINGNLTTMLAGLRAAAPHVPLFGMTYYNPFLGNWLAGGTARALTVATTPTLVAFNHELTSLYGGPKKTADVQNAFKATDFKTRVSSRWGRVPVAVQRACFWLDIVCHKASLEDFGDDPNIFGSAMIASAFEQKIGSLRPVHRKDHWVPVS